MKALQRTRVHPRSSLEMGHWPMTARSTIMFSDHWSIIRSLAHWSRTSFEIINQPDPAMSLINKKSNIPCKKKLLVWNQSLLLWNLTGPRPNFVSDSRQLVWLLTARGNFSPLPEWLTVSAFSKILPHHRGFYPWIRVSSESSPMKILPHHRGFYPWIRVSSESSPMKIVHAMSVGNEFVAVFDNWNLSFKPNSTLCHSKQ